MSIVSSKGWGLVAALLTVIGTANAAAPTDPQKDDEKEKEPVFTLLGAGDGPFKTRSATTDFATSLTIELLSDQAVDVTVRVGPLLDVQGQVHEVRIVTAASAQPAGPANELRAHMEPHGTVSIPIAATLEPEGDYSGELILLAGETRKSVRLAVTRGPSDLGVEILGLETADADAEPFGRESTATLRLTLTEKLGRKVELAAPTLIEYARKNGNARSSASFRIVADENPTSLVLERGESEDLSLQLAGFKGAGEYVGKLRFAAPGMRPADAAFTVSLREPAWAAFAAIFAGVLLSTLLRWLGQRVRPRLVERRRLYQFVLELDRLLQESEREPEEYEAFQALREHCRKLLAAGDRGDVAAVRGKIDLVESRIRLAIEWVPWRRRVLALSPPELRARFSATVDSVALVIKSDTSDALEIKGADETLGKLREGIDTALREALDKRSKLIRSGIAALNARPTSELAVRATTEVKPLLDHADGLLATDLQSALRVYTQARERWAALLLTDLDQVLAADLPVQVDNAALALLRQPLAAEVKAATQRLSEDVDGGVAQYESLLARYIAGLSDLLPAQFATIRQKVDAAITGGRKTKELMAAPALLDTAGSAVTQARQDNLDGKRQEALAKLWTAMQSAAEAKAATSGGTRGFTADAVAEAIVPVGAAPESLADPCGQYGARRRDTWPFSQASVRLFERLTDAIDVVSTLIALVVASVLGITTLWASDATWGGWLDWLFAALWGLGLHQFTFAGVNSLRDRLLGNAVAGATP